MFEQLSHLILIEFPFRVSKSRGILWAGRNAVIVDFREGLQKGLLFGGSGHEY